MSYTKKVWESYFDEDAIGYNLRVIEQDGLSWDCHQAHITLFGDTETLLMVRKKKVATKAEAKQWAQSHDE